MPLVLLLVLLLLVVGGFLSVLWEKYQCKFLNFKSELDFGFEKIPRHTQVICEKT